MRFRFRLVPTDDRFFALFNQSAMNAAECARLLRDLVNEFKDIEAKHSLVVDCERRGDQLTHHLLQLLSIDQVLPELKEQADLLVQMADQMVGAVGRLRSMRGTGPFLRAIDTLESE